MRYSRQELFIGKAGQKKLLKSKVAVIGIGGLGTIVSEQFLRAGIGKIILFDNDKVELSNLQRQSLFDEKDIGKYKTSAAIKKLKLINSKINLQEHKERITEKNIQNLLKDKIELIVDCTDNIESRKILNDYSNKTKIPVVFCGVAGSKGFLMVKTQKTPCFECVFPYFSKTSKTDNSSNKGIITPLTYFAASLQAAEAMKILLGKEFTKELVLFDILSGKIEHIKIKKRKGCCR